MTNTEAIKILNECRDRGFERTTYTIEEYHTARDMAIKALQEQADRNEFYNWDAPIRHKADGEYISRQATINGVPKLCNGIACAECPFESINDVCKIKEWLSFLPSVAIPPDHDGCKDCRWQSQSETEMPCKQCMHNYTDEWERAKIGHWESIGEEYIQVYDIAGIPSRGDKRRCSECGFQKVFIGRHYNQYKFCPECGSPMEIER